MNRAAIYCLERRILAFGGAAFRRYAAMPTLQQFQATSLAIGRRRLSMKPDRVFRHSSVYDWQTWSDYQ
jgi:hypothetical protein